MPPGGYASFSWIAFLTLLGVLGLSCVVFWMLVRRATSHRQWVALSDWNRSRGFRYHPLGDGGAQTPQPFAKIAASTLRARLWLTSKSTELVQLRTGESNDDATTSNVLVRQVESNWPPTALRPAKERSLLDLFSLASYPSMIASERFVIFGADSAAARTLSKSSLPALLPPDVGLLLHGRQMVIDFSDRPFDPLEFDRMLALANSLISHLPALKK